MAAVTAARSRSRLGGDFVSINVNPLDGLEPLDLQLRYWDDRHDEGMAACAQHHAPPSRRRDHIAATTLFKVPAGSCVIVW